MKTRSILIATAALAAIGAGTAGVAAAAVSTTSASPGQAVVIDGQTDQADAVAALKLYPNASNRSFTPIGAPSYSQSNWQPVKGPDGQTAGSVSGNTKTGQPGVAKITTSYEESSSVSLGGSAEVTLGFDLPGIVDAELSAKFTANHTWSSSYTDSQSIQVTADPGKTVWIEVADNTVSYTGNFSFDSGGVHYEVDNVTINQPGSAQGGTIDSAIYRVRQIDSSQIDLPANASGVVPLSALPRLRQYIAAGN